ncbi:hypothetical protein NFI96_024443, partial [Prochilodus magdalenae]
MLAELELECAGSVTAPITRVAAVRARVIDEDDEEPETETSSQNKESALPLGQEVLTKDDGRLWRAVKKNSASRSRDKDRR